MASDVLQDYPHLKFQRCWQLNTRAATELGKCCAYIEALGSLPIPPEAQSELRKVAFERGAQATTAIEGNTLTEEELKEILAGNEVPKSREYQAQEVMNALQAMNGVWKQVLDEDSREHVSAKLICKWNKQIGSNLGPLYDGVPGKFRQDRRHVGTYLAPKPEDVPDLIDRLCKWLRDEFGYGKRDVPIEESIQQAIAAHVYFEWIHPFADGNGRTGRLLEFYILLRSGFPDITVHVLANHYNQSRPEYAAHFENARRKRSLSEFMSYAIQGLSDGLRATLRSVQRESFKIAWESHVYRTFSEYTDYTKKSVFKRRRELALSMPVDRKFSVMELVRSSDELAKEYMGRDPRMMNADAEILIELELMLDNGDGSFSANVEPMLAQHLSARVV
jgi:cell filamentation protein, protein adenylyltransferase